MKRVPMLLLAAGLLMAARPSLPQLGPHNMQAEKFIEYITVASPYTQWATWPGKGKLFASKDPTSHGPLITTYVNGAALLSIAEMKGMADGSIIVVENYTADRQLAGLTTMYKVAGYNKEAGDWYWVEATPGGNVISFGKVRACIDCHSAQASNDYVWTAETVSGKYKPTAVP